MKNKGTPTHPCLFSAISGTITLEGKPVSNARLKRITRRAYGRKEISDETHTDEKGYFSMPSIFDRDYIGGILPGEFSVPQRVYLYDQGKEWDIWGGVKRTEEENAESKGKPLIVQCELTNERVLMEVSGGVIFSYCRWDVELDKVVPISDLLYPED